MVNGRFGSGPAAEIRRSGNCGKDMFGDEVYGCI